MEKVKFQIMPTRKKGMLQVRVNRWNPPWLINSSFDRSKDIFYNIFTEKKASHDNFVELILFLRLPQVMISTSQQVKPIVLDL